MANVDSYLVPSGPPQNLTISVTSNTAVLFWSPPLLSQRNGIITTYFVVCVIGNVTKKNRNSSFTYEITLEPFTSYNCSVSASTTIGDGPSAFISGISDEDSKYPNIIMTVTLMVCICSS